MQLWNAVMTAAQVRKTRGSERSNAPNGDSCQTAVPGTYQAPHRIAAHSAQR